MQDEEARMIIQDTL